MPNDPIKKDKNEKEDVKDTKVKVSEIIDFGQKISNDWLEAETQRKVQVKQQKQQNKNQDQEPEEEEQPPVVQNPRSYNYY